MLAEVCVELIHISDLSFFPPGLLNHHRAWVLLCCSWQSVKGCGACPEWPAVPVFVPR